MSRVPVGVNIPEIKGLSGNQRGLTHAAVTPRNGATIAGRALMTGHPSDSDAERLRRIEGRLAELRRRDEPKPRADEHFSQANIAWRMVIELVSGLGIGFAIGYGLDWALGTAPWLLVIFVLAGFAAGVKTMLRTAQELGRAQDKGQQAEPSAEDEED